MIKKMVYSIVIVISFFDKLIFLRHGKWPAQFLWLLKIELSYLIKSEAVDLFCLDVKLLVIQFPFWQTYSIQFLSSLFSDCDWKNYDYYVY